MDDAGSGILDEPLRTARMEGGQRHSMTGAVGWMVILTEWTTDVMIGIRYIIQTN